MCLKLEVFHPSLDREPLLQITYLLRWGCHIFSANVETEKNPESVLEENGFGCCAYNIDDRPIGLGDRWVR